MVIIPNMDMAIPAAVDSEATQNESTAQREKREYQDLDSPL
jgi:hypothetical protein